MDKKILQVLHGSALFKGVAAVALEGMLVCLRPAVNSYAKGTYIAVEGEPVVGIGILIKGQAGVIKENAAGSRMVMASLKEGDMFGEMVVFSQNRQWPASVVAQSDCVAVFLPPDRLMSGCAAVCSGYTQLMQNLLLLVSERALLLNRKVEYLAMKSLRAKVVAYLLEQHRHSGKSSFTLPYSRNDLADFLNVSRTALSRELGRMRDEGLIEFYRASVKIKDLAGLRRM